MSASDKFRLYLNGKWKMGMLGSTEFIPATVPGTVLSDLLCSGKISDPFWRENEKHTKKLFYNDFIYERCFDILPEQLENDELVLVCLGLDTLAEIYINNELLANTDNMHRTWRFDIKKNLYTGKNNITIIIRSPLRYIEEKSENSDITYAATGCQKGNNYLRKAHCMFGWDWGPQLPDAGIWRSIYIEGTSPAKFDDVYISQEHSVNRVLLNIRLKVSTQKGINHLTVRCIIVSPDNEIIESEIDINSNEELLTIVMDNPQIWWPNGYGTQPLYDFSLELIADGIKLDSYNRKIGLRTLKVSQEKDKWGSEFALKVNGVKIFAMGADYIPEDSIISRTGRDRTEKLIKSCVKTNFNCIRVWGGGYYPPDYFYDLCDQYGLIVWQDLMFACNIYDMTSEFTINIQKEVADNVIRIRNHASLGLWCGNNEMELAWLEWEDVKGHSPKLKADYIRLFEILLPGILSDLDPETFYWPASPSSGGCFDDPNDENRGDVHAWNVWHGFKPFTDYRKSYYRFCSEFGFESFPELKTIKSFTLEEDRNIFSRIMENHQKCPSGNGKILFYLAENFKYPKDFDSLIYVSQLLQAEAMRYGVEHWRRYRGRCMGAIYWQLNDCWPAASWSSIDYYGRWKALQYAARRFFAPLMLSIEDDNTNIRVFLHNETREDKSGQLNIKIRNNNFHIIFENSIKSALDSLSAVKVFERDFADLLTDEEMLGNSFLEAELVIDGKVHYRASHIFVKPKYFNFNKANYSIEVNDEGEHIELKIGSSCYTKFVELRLKEADCIFSDNYFDISSPDGVTIYIDKKENLIEETNFIAQNIKIRSIIDSF